MPKRWACMVTGVGHTSRDAKAGSLRLRRADQDDGLGSGALAVGHTRKALACLPCAHPTFEAGQGRAAKYLKKINAPDTIRTCDLCLRRATLYPAELRVRTRVGPHPLTKTLDRSIRYAPIIAALHGRGQAPEWP